MANKNTTIGVNVKVEQHKELKDVLKELKEIKRNSGDIKLPSSTIKKLDETIARVEALERKITEIEKGKLNLSKFLEFSNTVQSTFDGILSSVDSLLDAFAAFDNVRFDSVIENVENLQYKLASGEEKIVKSVKSEYKKLEKLSDTVEEATSKKSSKKKEETLKDDKQILNVEAQVEKKAQEKVKLTKEENNLLKTQEKQLNKIIGLYDKINDFEPSKKGARYAQTKNNPEGKKNEIKAQIEKYKEVASRKNTGRLEDESKRLLELAGIINEIRSLYETTAEFTLNKNKEIVPGKNIWEAFAGNDEDLAFAKEIVDNYKTFTDVINDFLAKIEEGQKKIVDSKSPIKNLTYFRLSDVGIGQEEIDALFVKEKEKIDNAIENQDFFDPSKPIEFKLEVPESEKKKLGAELDALSKELTSNTPPVKIQVTYVSAYKTREQNKLLKSLQDDVVEIENYLAGAGEIPENLAEKFGIFQEQLNNALTYGTPELKLRTNIKDIEKKEIPAALEQISKIIKDENLKLTPIMVINEEKVQEQLNNLKPFSLNIDEVVFQPGFISSLETIDKLMTKAEEKGTDINGMVKDANEKLAEIEDKKKKKESEKKKDDKKEDKAVKKSKEEQRLEKLIEDSKKYAELVKRISKNLGTIPIEVNATFNYDQVQEALNNLENLYLEISKIKLKDGDNAITLDGANLNITGANISGISGGGAQGGGTDNKGKSSGKGTQKSDAETEKPKDSKKDEKPKDSEKPKTDTKPKDQGSTKGNDDKNTEEIKGGMSEIAEQIKKLAESLLKYEKSKSGELMLSPTQSGQRATKKFLTTLKENNIPASAIEGLGFPEKTTQELQEAYEEMLTNEVTSIFDKIKYTATGKISKKGLLRIPELANALARVGQGADSSLLWGNGSFIRQAEDTKEFKAEQIGTRNIKNAIFEYLEKNKDGLPAALVVYEAKKSSVPDFLLGEAGIETEEEKKKSGSTSRRIVEYKGRFIDVTDQTAPITSENVINYKGRQSLYDELDSVFSYINNQKKKLEKTGYTLNEEENVKKYDEEITKIFEQKSEADRKAAEQEEALRKRVEADVAQYREQLAKDAAKEEAKAFDSTALINDVLKAPQSFNAKYSGNRRSMLDTSLLSYSSEKEKSQKLNESVADISERTANVASFIDKKSRKKFYNKYVVTEKIYGRANWYARNMYDAEEMALNSIIEASDEEFKEFKNKAKTGEMKKYIASKGKKSKDFMKDLEEVRNEYIQDGLRGVLEKIPKLTDPEKREGAVKVASDFIKKYRPDVKISGKGGTFKSLGKQYGVSDEDISKLESLYKVDTTSMSKLTEKFEDFKEEEQKKFVEKVTQLALKGWSPEAASEEAAKQIEEERSKSQAHALSDEEKKKRHKKEQKKQPKKKEKKETLQDKLANLSQQVELTDQKEIKMTEDNVKSIADIINIIEDKYGEDSLSAYKIEDTAKKVKEFTKDKVSQSMVKKIGEFKKYREEGSVSNIQNIVQKLDRPVLSEGRFDTEEGRAERELNDYKTRLEQVDKLAKEVLYYKERLKDKYGKEFTDEDVLRIVFPKSAMSYNQAIKELGRRNEYADRIKTLEEGGKTTEKTAEVKKQETASVLTKKQTAEINKLINQLEFETNEYDNSVYMVQSEQNEKIKEQLVELVAKIKGKKKKPLNYESDFRGIISVDAIESKANENKQLIAEYKKESDDLFKESSAISKKLKRFTDEEIKDPNNKEYKELLETKKKLDKQIEEIDGIIQAIRSTRTESYESFHGELGALLSNKNLVKMPEDIELETEMKEVGKDAVKGNAEGIEESKELPKEAIRDVVQETIDEAKKTQDSHSPSIVFKKIGQDAVLGYVEGINETRKQLDDAAEKLYVTPSRNAVKDIDKMLDALPFDFSKGGAVPKNQEQLANTINSMATSLINAGYSIGEAFAIIDKQTDKSKAGKKLLDEFRSNFYQRQFQINYENQKDINFEGGHHTSAERLKEIQALEEKEESAVEQVQETAKQQVETVAKKAEQAVEKTAQKAKAATKEVAQEESKNIDKNSSKKSKAESKSKQQKINNVKEVAKAEEKAQEKAQSSNSKNNALWYGTFSKILSTSKAANANRLSRDLSTYKEANGITALPDSYEGWKSVKILDEEDDIKVSNKKINDTKNKDRLKELENLENFYDEYVEYLDALIKMAESIEDKDERRKAKTNAKDYKKYVVSQKKQIASQKAELEKYISEQEKLDAQKNALVLKEDDAARQALQRARERGILGEGKNAVLVGKEYKSLTQKEIDEGIRVAREEEAAYQKELERNKKIRQKQARQADKEYIYDTKRQTQAARKYGTLSNLLRSDKLDGTVRKDVQDLSVKMFQISKGASVTDKEFADLQLRMTEVVNSANTLINYNKELEKSEKERTRVLEEEANIRHAIATAQAKQADQVAQQREKDKKALISPLQSILSEQNKYGTTPYTQAYLQEVSKGISDIEDFYSGKTNAIDVNAIEQLVSNKKLLKNMIGDTEELTNTIEQARLKLKNLYISEDAKNQLQDVIIKMEQLAQKTDVTKLEVEELVNEFKNIKFDAVGESYAKNLTKIINDPRYTKAYKNQAQQMLSQVLSGTYDSQMVSGLLAGYADASNLAGSHKDLQSMIIKGNKMLSTNYVPAGLQKQIKQVIDEMVKLDSQTDISRESVENLATAFRTLEAEAAGAGKTFIGQIGQRLKDMNAKFIAQYFSIMDLIRYFRSMISTITELDTALTEMRKVSDESIQSLKEYQKVTFDTAGALGTTAVQLQQTTADWLRLGESMEQAAESAKVATTLLNVSEFENIGEATEALVAMSQAYKDLDKTEIIDVLNNIGNNYSIATDQLATALQASSAALMTQGNDLYEAAALVTAGNAVIQDASKVGTGIRTISLRIAGEKMGKEELQEELQELGEEVDDWVVQTEAKKRQVIMDYTRVASNNGEGVDILDPNGNLKDTYHILLEISKVYKEIQEEDKKYGTNRAQALVEELAGKVRSNIAASILMNPQLLEDVYNSALNSAGSAAEENAKYLDSIVGKTNQFKNELQELESNVLDSELIKQTIDFGTTILSIINQIGDALPTIIALVGSLAFTIASAKNNWVNFINFDKETGDLGLFGRFKIDKSKGFKDNFANILDSIFGEDEELTKRAVSFQKVWETIWKPQNIDFTNDALKEVFETLGEGFDTEDMLPEDALAQFDEFLDTVGGNIEGFNDEVSDMAKNLYANGVDSAEAFSEAESAVATSSEAAAIGVEVLNAALTFFGTIAITLAVSAIVRTITNLANASEDAAREFDEFNSKLQATRKTLKENKEYIDKIGDEYEKLSKGVDEAGNNISLSTEDFKKYNDITEKIAEMFPELIKGWDDTGKAILDTTGKVRELTEAYKENKRESLAKILTGNENGSAKSAFDNYNELMDANWVETAKSFFKNKSILAAGEGADYEYLMKNMELIINTPYESLNTRKYLDSRENNAIVEALHTLNVGGDEAFRERYSKLTQEEYRAAQQQAVAYKMVYEQQMEPTLKGLGDIASAYLEFNPDYDKLSENGKKIASALVNSIDSELASSFEGDPMKMAVWVNQIIEEIEGLGEEGLDENLLSILLFGSNGNKTFNEARNEAVDAYEQISKAIDAEIAKDPARETELKRIQQNIFNASGLGDMNDLYTRMNNSLENLAGGSESELAMLQDATKNFTEEEIELWLKTTTEINDATYALKKFNDEKKKIPVRQYDSIGALLSQDNPIRDWDRERINPDKAEQLRKDYERELDKAKAANADLERTVYGNIDLNNRAVLKWDENTLAKYRANAESWFKQGYDEVYQKEYDKYLKEHSKEAGLVYGTGKVDEYALGFIKKDAEEHAEAYATAYIDKLAENIVNGYEGTISTVLGSYDDEHFDGIGIAYSPLLQVDGKAVPLNQNTIDQYFAKIENELKAKNLEANAENILKIDAMGFEVEGQKIKNIIADIGETAETTSMTMHYLGEDGSLNLILKELQQVEYYAPTWQEVRDDLVGMAQSGKLDTKTFKDYEYFNDIIKALGLSAEVTDEQINQMIDDINKMANNNAVDRLSGAKTELDKLDNAYQKFKSNKVIDATTLNEVQDAFAYLGSSYRDFEEAVMSGETDLQEYFDEIATQYAIQEGLLGNLTEENREWTVLQLKNAGITKESAEAGTKQALENKKALEANLLTQIKQLNTYADIDEELNRYIVDAKTIDELDTQAVSKLVSEILLREDLSAELQSNAENIALYTLQKELASGKDLSNPEDLNYLMDLINSCGVATDAIKQLVNAKQLNEQLTAYEDRLAKFKQQYGNDKSKWGYYGNKEYYEITSGISAVESELNKLPNAAEQARKDVVDAWAKRDPNLNIGFDYAGAIDSSKQAAEDALAKAKETLDKILAMYDAELDAGVISFKEYVDKSRGIIDQYYQEGKIKASDYYNYISELYEKQVSEYDKVISAVQRRIRKETESLEKQKESIEESYNLQIEEIQKKIDVLQEENDEIDRNLALSKAQYQLARQQHQRTKLMYSESRGFYYEADLQGIAEAQENVRKAQLDKTVSELQKRITELQNSMKKETDAIDEQIKSLNEWSEEWSHVSEVLKEEMEDQRATEILGQNWEEEILNQRRDVLEQFTKDYVALQEAQKKAALDARKAELGEYEASGNSGDSAGKRKKDGSDGNYNLKTTGSGSTSWEYNGKDYEYEDAANKTREADAQKIWDDYYNSEIKKLEERIKNTSIPPEGRRELIERIKKAADEEKEKYIKSHPVKKKTVYAKYTGTDSAQSGETLVGELGSEIVLHKNGTASIVDSPTLMNMKGGEKVFNAEETEKILKSKYVPLKKFNPKKFAMLHAFANGTSSPMQSMIAAQAVGIANGLNKGLIATSSMGGQTINQTFNVSLPNITDSSKATELFKEFEQLQRKATQFFN